MPDLEFYRPATVPAALAAVADHPYGKIVAGGTAVVLMLQQGLIFPTALISLAALDELRGIAVDGGTLRIGALTTLTEVAESPVVRRHFPSLAYACRRVGNVRIRNVATLGGNMAEADYASDPPAVLVTLQAVLTLRSATGERRVPAAEFITGFYSNALETGEIVTSIAVPLPAEPQRTVYLKYISRSSEDRPCVGVAARAAFDGERLQNLNVVVGAVAATPQHFADVVDKARQRRLTPELADEIAAAYAERVEPIDDMRGSAWYRREMVRVFVRRALEEVAGRGETDG